jgi:hypothetical protein
MNKNPSDGVVMCGWISWNESLIRVTKSRVNKGGLPTGLKQ